MIHNSIIQAFLFFLGFIFPDIFFWTPFFCIFKTKKLFLREGIIFFFIIFPLFLWIYWFNKCSSFIFIVFFFLFFLNLIIVYFCFLIELKFDINIFLILRYLQYYSIYFFSNGIVIPFYFPLITFGNFTFFIFNIFLNYPWLNVLIYFFIFNILLKNKYIIFIFVTISIVLFFLKDPFGKEEINENFPCKIIKFKDEFIRLIEINKRFENVIFPETSIIIDDYSEILELKNIAIDYKINIFIGAEIKILNEFLNIFEKKNYLLKIMKSGDLFLREKNKKIPFVEEPFRFVCFKKNENKNLNDSFYICSELFLSSFENLKKNCILYLLASNRWAKNTLTFFYFKNLIFYKNLIEKFNNCLIKTSYSEIIFY